MLAEGRQRKHFTITTRAGTMLGATSGPLRGPDNDDNIPH
jgi:hypothetical protein